MSVAEVLDQVKTLSEQEQAELFHHLEEQHRLRGVASRYAAQWSGRQLEVSTPDINEEASQTIQQFVQENFKL
jgi:hypothetical protein